MKSDVMTDAEIDELLAKEDAHRVRPAGAQGQLWRVRTPDGERTFRADGIDRAMQIAAAIPDAGHPTRVEAKP